MPKLLRKLLGLLLLTTTIGLATCQSLSNAINANNDALPLPQNNGRGLS